MVFEIAQMCPWSFNTRGYRGLSRSGVFAAQTIREAVYDLF